jgi:hypothetical protein
LLEFFEQFTAESVQSYRGKLRVYTAETALVLFKPVANTFTNKQNPWLGLRHRTLGLWGANLDKTLQSLALTGRYFSNPRSGSNQCRHQLQVLEISLSILPPSRG